MGKSGGFTLIELLVVLAILALLAGLVGPRVMSALGGAQTKTAQTQIGNISTAVEMYYLDMGHYPPNLEALVRNPGGRNTWNGPYLDRPNVPTDPWGNPYHYKYPGDHGTFDLFTLGSDNAVGGTGDATDVTNWD